MHDVEKALELFRSDLVVINVGSAMLGEALSKQGASVVQVDWEPPAGGDRQMQELLKLLGGIE